MVMFSLVRKTTQKVILLWMLFEQLIATNQDKQRLLCSLRCCNLAVASLSQLDFALKSQQYGVLLSPLTSINLALTRYCVSRKNASSLKEDVP